MTVNCCKYCSVLGEVCVSGGFCTVLMGIWTSIDCLVGLHATFIKATSFMFSSVMFRNIRSQVWLVTWLVVFFLGQYGIMWYDALPAQSRKCCRRHNETVWLIFVVCHSLQQDYLFYLNCRKLCACCYLLLIDGIILLNRQRNLKDDKHLSCGNQSLFCDIIFLFDILEIFYNGENL